MTVLLPHFGCRGDLPLVITKKNVIFFIIKNGAQIGVLYAPIFFPVFVLSEVSCLLSYREKLLIFRSKKQGAQLVFYSKLDALLFAILFGGFGFRFMRSIDLSPR